jgi:hypothetical protein
VLRKAMSMGAGRGWGGVEGQSFVSPLPDFLEKDKCRKKIEREREREENVPNINIKKLLEIYSFILRTNTDP